MYSSTFLRAQLDLNVFLPAARVGAFFVIRVLHTGLLLTKRYVPPSEGTSCIQIHTRTSYNSVQYKGNLSGQGTLL